MNTNEFIEQVLQPKIKNCASVKEAFDRKFETDPMGAVAWSMDLFEAAATARVADEVKHALDNGATAENVISTLDADVSRTARYPSMSTSPVSNLADTMELSARAKMLEAARRYLKD